MDFANETLTLEHLAVRFKLEETMTEFKKVFKECQDNIKDKKPDVTPKEEVKDVRESNLKRFTSSCSNNNSHSGTGKTGSEVFRHVQTQGWIMGMCRVPL
jgi:hypothetical protein